MRPSTVVWRRNGHEAHLAEHAQDEILNFEVDIRMNILWKFI